MIAQARMNSIIHWKNKKKHDTIYIYFRKR